MSIPRGILWAGTIIVMIIMVIYSYPFYHRDIPSIFSAQTEVSSSKAKALLDVWLNTKTSKGSLVPYARIVTWYDFLFIFFYTMLGISLSNRSQLEPRVWANALLRLNMFLVVVVALLDIGENSFFFYNLNMIGESYINTWWLSWLKWGIAIWIILVLLISMFRKQKHTA